MSRPRKFDDALRANVLRSVLEGATLAEAAASVGCVARTLNREARRDPAFGERLAIARRVGARARREMRVADAGEGVPQPNLSTADMIEALTDALRQNWSDNTASHAA